MWLIFYVIEPLKSGSILNYQKQEVKQRVEVTLDKEVLKRLIEIEGDRSCDLDGLLLIILQLYFTHQCMSIIFCIFKKYHPCFCLSHFCYDMWFIDKSNFFVC